MIDDLTKKILNYVFYITAAIYVQIGVVLSGILSEGRFCQRGFCHPTGLSVCVVFFSTKLAGVPHPL